MPKQGKKPVRHPGYILLILLLLFIIPMVLAWIFYEDHGAFLGRKVNHGELIMPPISIEKVAIHNEKGDLLDNRLTDSKEKPPEAQRTNGKWTLMLLNGNACDKVCEEAIFKLRQIRTATGKRQERVARAVLNYTVNPAMNAFIQQHFPGTRHLTVDQKAFATLVRKNTKIQYALHKGVIYIVDPLGNIMMVFKPGADATAIYKDLTRLLKVSQIG